MKGHETQMHASSRRTPAVVAGLIAALGLGAGAGAFAYAVAIDEPGQVVRQVTVEDSEPAASVPGLRALIAGDHPSGRYQVAEVPTPLGVT